MAPLAVPASTRRRLAPGALALGLGLAALLLSACNPATPYAAIVNGTRISQAQLTHELKSFAANAAFLDQYSRAAASQTPPRPGILNTGTAHPTFTQSFTSTVLGLDIQAAVVHAEVVRRRLEPPANTIDSPATASAAGQQFGADANQNPIFPKFNAWFRHLFQLRQAEQDALAKVLPAPPAVDAAAIQKFYDRNPQDFVTAQCVSHILVATQAQANAVAAQLAGGADFGTVALQNSTDQNTASKGGDLGCAAPGAGTTPIEQDSRFLSATSAAPIGQVSQPLQLSSGWDVFLVRSRTEQPLTDAVKQAIQQHLQQGAASTPMAQFFQQAAAKLKVTVNPQYGHWDQQQFAIVPPTAPDPSRTGLPAGVTTPTSPPSSGP